MHVMKQSSFILFSISLLGAGAQAASIGINFGSGRANAALDPADVAGVVPQSNWNNAAGASGSLTVLNTDGGTASGAALSWATDEQWSIGGPGADANGTLLNGWVSANNTADPPAAIDVTNIPFAVYDLYVYMNHDRDSEDVDVTGPFGTFRLHENNSDILSPISFVEQTVSADGDPTQQGNYARFANLTASDLNLILSPAGTEGSVDRGAITGIQLVQVPEPSASLLVAVAALAGGLRRRR